MMTIDWAGSEWELTKDSGGLTKDSNGDSGASGTIRSRAMKALRDKKFKRFIEHLLAFKEPCKVAAQLQREGVDLLRVFVELRVYTEGRTIAGERRKRKKQDLNIINEGVRKHGVAPGTGAWLRDRNELARSVDGLGRVHNVDSLAGAHIYLELRTGRRVTMKELGYLVDATYWGLGKKTTADEIELGRELRRHRQRPENVNFLKILKDHIRNTL